MPYLLDNLGYHARTHCAATLANRKTQTVFHRNRCYQRRNHLHIVTRHHHLNTFRQLNRTRYVRRPEVKLRPITLKERRVTPALFLRQNVHLCLKLGVRVN